MVGRLTTEDFIRKSKLKHGDDVFDYSEVDYIKAIIKVTVICPIHGRFQITPNNHLNGRGCPVCGKQRSVDAKRSNLEDWIEKAKLIHGSKFDYSKANYIDSETKIEIICKNGHNSFWQRPTTHLSGAGCFKCGKIEMANRLRSSLEIFVQNASEVHKNLYSYENFIYIDNTTKGFITCHKHGDYLQIPSNHITLKHGCPKCAFEESSIKKKKDQEWFLSRAAEVHKNLYDYSKSIYDGQLKPIIIICNKHQEFIQTPKQHLKGKGCNKCSSSHGEIKILNFLQENNIKFNIQESFKNTKNPCKNLLTNRFLKFDFYLPDFNLCIEYQGEQHYRPVVFSSKDKIRNRAEDNFKKNIFRDGLKVDYCRNNNIILLCIPYTEKENIPSILGNFLNLERSKDVQPTDNR